MMSNLIKLRPLCIPVHLWRSFDQVYISRLAYQLYEEDDLTGLKLSEDNVMKTIKV